MLSYGIETPWTGAREDEIKEHEGVERGEFSAVQYRIESLAGMRHEIGGRRKAGENESYRPREQADREQDASRQFDEPAHAHQRIDLNVREHWHSGKTENLPCAVLKQVQAGKDAKNAEKADGAGRPHRGKFV